MSKPITSIETINGKLCTVIKRKFDVEKVRESLAIGVPVVAWHRFWKKPVVIVNCYADRDGIVFYQGWFNESQTFALRDMVFSNTLTILPALPKHPKPEDAPLLYRYASEGLYARIDGKNNGVGRCISCGWPLYREDHKPPHAICRNIYCSGYASPTASATYNPIEWPTWCFFEKGREILDVVDENRGVLEVAIDGR